MTTVRRPASGVLLIRGAREHPAIHRHALSVMSNVAEAFGRASDQDFLRFLHYARSCAFEVQSSLILARDIGKLAPDAFDRLDATCERAISLITAFRSYLEGGRTRETIEHYVP